VALTLTSVTPNTISTLGGHLLKIEGTFTIGHRYQVFIGDIGSTVDPACYSGVPGQGSAIYPVTSAVLLAYSPAMAPSDPTYKIGVVDLDGPEAALMPAAITVLKKQFYTAVYGLRKPLPPTWGLGPRSVEQEPPTS
jgi:hypothetical protein